MTAQEEPDVALKLLHTADWHLGLRFPAVAPEQEVRLTRARLEVVSRILDLADNRNVDAVLCAGDLFNEPHPEEEWWKGREGSNRLPRCPGGHQVRRNGRRGGGARLLPARSGSTSPDRTCSSGNLEVERGVVSLARRAAPTSS